MITIRRKQKPDGEVEDIYLDAGQNPPAGVVVIYYLKEKPEGEVKLTFLDAEGKEIRSFVSKEEPAAKKEGDEQSGGEKSKQAEKDKNEPRVPKEAGANRFVWNMRYPNVTKVDGFAGADQVLAGPVLSPGTYKVQLTVGEFGADRKF